MPDRELNRAIVVDPLHARFGETGEILIYDDHAGEMHLSFSDRERVILFDGLSETSPQCPQAWQLIGFDADGLRTLQHSLEEIKPRLVDLANAANDEGQPRENRLRAKWTFSALFREALRTIAQN